MVLISFHRLAGTPDDQLGGFDGTWDIGSAAYSEGGADFDATNRVKFASPGTSLWDDMTKDAPWSASCIMKWGTSDQSFVTTTRPTVSSGIKGVGIRIAFTSVHFEAFAAADNWTVGQSGNPMFNTGKFHHMVGTFDGSSNQDGFDNYVDGALNRTGAFDAMTSTIDGVETPAIGAAAGGSLNAGMTGIVKDVKWYNNQLSLGEVALDYVQSGLLGLSRFGKYDLDSNAFDSSGANNHGTVDGPGGVFSSDRACGSTSFQGLGSVHINLANEAAFDQDFNDDFSISFWIKPGPGGSARDAVIAKGGGIDDDEGYYVIYDFSTNTLEWKFRGIDTTEYVLSASLPKDEWHYIVVTYDGLSDQNGMHMYIDGVKETDLATTATTGSMLNNQAVGLLGEADGSKEFHGFLDCVEFWDISLSSAIPLALFENFTSERPDYTSDYYGGT